MVKHLAAAAAALLAGALWTCDAMADEAAPPPPDLAAPPTRWGNRMLAGHTFLYPVTHAGAFVTSNLRPIASVKVAGGPGESGTPNAQFGEMVLRYIW